MLAWFLLPGADRFLAGKDPRFVNLGHDTGLPHGLLETPVPVEIPERR